MSEEIREEKAGRPSLDEINQEIERIRYKKTYGKALRGTVYAIIVVIALSVLAATFLFPVLQIFGNSMAPTIQEGEIVVTVKGGDMKTGDVVAFYYNNKILIKRVIGNSGDWINIDEAGNVSVNGTVLEEPYLSEKSLGECDITLPYQVPDGRIFVMGDHRATSVDSRTSAIGCISNEQIVGKVTLRVWPFEKIGRIN